MILPNPKDAIHKAWLYRLLIHIYDNQVLANSLYFKGGTCAAMRGFLDRFSIDLDFDYIASRKDLAIARENLETVFKGLDLIIKDASRKVPQYFLKYEPVKGIARNTIKIDTTMPPPKSNRYEAVRLNEIDRIVTCQTIETMFANKLVALIDRWERYGSVAGRDLYDIHHFYINGYRYDREVIIERRQSDDLKRFFQELMDFIEKEITETVIGQDLNLLLSYKKFQSVRKTLKQETLMFLKDEIRRLR